MRPDKEEFSQFVQFTTNIEDRLLDFHIRQSYDKVLRGKFADLIEVIFNSTAQTIEEFAESKPELAAFYTDYLLEYWILSAYRRFLAQHGINVAQAGLVRMSDPEGTFTAASGDDRAIILRQVDNDMKVCETRIYRKLCDVSWKFDGHTYVNPDVDARKVTPKKDFGIRPIPDTCEVPRNLKYLK